MLAYKDSYCAPCDRIGRWYTASAAGFTMNNATAVAKRLLEQKAVPKVIGFCLAVLFIFSGFFIVFLSYCKNMTDEHL
jgi:hypothetical protein